MLAALLGAWSSVAAAFPALILGENDPDTAVVSGKVVIVRQGRKTVLTIAPEVRSNATRLAVIVPVPGPVGDKNVNVADPGLIQSVDQWASPRLVAATDPDPCPLPGQKRVSERRVVGIMDPGRFEDGDYDIEPLNAPTLAGMKKHLSSLGFKLSHAGETALKPYLSAKSSFLVGVVRLKAAPAPTSRLKALQVAYESDAYEVPLRVGPVSGQTPLDLTIYAVSDKGRVDVLDGEGAPRAPSGDELPAAVLLDPKKFYKAMLGQLADKRPGTALLEHAWPGTWCEPCAADALTLRAWRKLGVFWISQGAKAADVFVTRLHVLYGAKQQKADLALRETSDKNNFQTRFFVREPFQGRLTCASGSEYVKGLDARREKEAAALSRLTGWDLARSRKEADAKAPAGKAKTWVDDLWQD